MPRVLFAFSWILTPLMAAILLGHAAHQALGISRAVIRTDALAMAAILSLVYIAKRFIQSRE